MQGLQFYFKFAYELITEFVLRSLYLLNEAPLLVYLFYFYWVFKALDFIAPNEFIFQILEGDWKSSTYYWSL